MRKEETLEEDTNLALEDMLVHDEGDSSLSTLLGETQDNLKAEDEIITEDDSTGEYCPFKALEESSSNIIANIELDDTLDTDDQ